MFSYESFFDSSFHHTCLIVPEEDVLNIDMVGSGCFFLIKRWWHDLFLLSYKTPRLEGFYTSSHAMRTERFRQFRKYQSRIHPMSKFRNFWEFLILHVIILNMVIFRYTSSFIYDDLCTIYFYFGPVLECIIMIDLYVSLKTGYIDYEAKTVVLNTKECIINFCSTKLFLHLAAAIPLHWLMFLRYGSNIRCGLCKANRFNSVLKILSTFRLFRLYEASGYWVKKCTTWVYFFQYLRIWVLGLATILQIYELHDSICLMEFIKYDRVVKKSILGFLTKLKYTSENSNYKVMVIDFFRILKSLLLFTVGNVYTEYYLDKLTSFIVYVVARFIYGWAILKFYTILCRRTYTQDQIWKVKRSASQMLKYYQLSNILGKKVEDYFKIKSIKTTITEKKNELYRSLPEVIKVEIKLNCYMKLLMRLPLFSHWPVPVITELVIILEKKVYLHNDILMLPYVNGEGLMIVDKGVLAVYTEDYKEVGHLIDGDYFGELSLVTDRELCASCVVSITSTTVLLLDKALFREVMRNYPKLFRDLKENLKNKAINRSISTV